MTTGTKLFEAKQIKFIGKSRSFSAKTLESRRDETTQPPTVISPEDMGSLKREHRGHSMPATSTMSLSTIEKFDTEDQQDHEVQPQAESML